MSDEYAECSMMLRDIVCLLLEEYFLVLLTPFELGCFAMVSHDFQFILKDIESRIVSWTLSNKPWYRLCSQYVQHQIDNGHSVYPSLSNIMAMTRSRCAFCHELYGLGYLNVLGVMIHARCLYPLVEDIRSGDTMTTTIIEIWKDDERVRQTVWPVDKSFGILYRHF